MRIANLFGLFFSHLPIKKNWVYFSSFYGLYNDNPKAISEKLHQIDENIVIIWEQASRSREIIPDYCIRVRLNTIRASYYFSRSHVILDNGAGYFYYNNHHKFHWILKSLINKESINISSWHGTPLKHIGFDIPDCDLDKKSLYSSSKAILAGSDYEFKVFTTCFDNMFPVLKVGNPRNDVLINRSFRINELKKKLNLPLNRKILLFCPTFRNNLEDSGLIQLGLIDVEGLKQALSVKFSGTWEIVFRAHQMVFERIDFEKYKIINGNIGDDMADYLACSDAIITDYSGSLFDVCLTDKPCFLFAHDRANYISNERGTYLDLNELPFPFAETYTDLIKNIENYSKDIDLENKRNFNAMLGSYNDGKASERAASLIIEILNGEGITKNA